jgi:alpha/beta superfamily hydrolase
VNILLLPGNSKSNKDWIDKLAEDFGKHFEEIKVFHWDHWNKWERTGNWKQETENAIEAVKDWENYIVLSKSFGDLVALALAQKAENKPSKMYLLGFPVKFAENLSFPTKSMLADCPSELVFIQKDRDPACGYDDLVEYLKQFDVPKYETLKYHVDGEPDDTHHYGSSERLLGLIKN